MNSGHNLKDHWSQQFSSAWIYLPIFLLPQYICCSQVEFFIVHMRYSNIYVTLQNLFFLVLKSIPNRLRRWDFWLPAYSFLRSAQQVCRPTEQLKSQLVLTPGEAPHKERLRLQSWSPRWWSWCTLWSLSALWSQMLLYQRSGIIRYTIHTLMPAQRSS